MAVRGSWGVVAWARDGRGRFPGKEFYDGLRTSDKAKVIALFTKLAETGEIRNREKFKKVVDSIWEFKSFQLRFLGAYRRGGRFFIATGLVKKKDEHRPQDIATAKRILKENDETEGML